jgi:hypothetical protein
MWNATSLAIGAKLATCMLKKCTLFRTLAAVGFACGPRRRFGGQSSSLSDGCVRDMAETVGPHKHCGEKGQFPFENVGSQGLSIRPRRRVVTMDSRSERPGEEESRQANTCWYFGHLDRGGSGF